MTKPVRTERETKRISTSSRSRPKTIWNSPASKVAQQQILQPMGTHQGRRDQRDRPRRPRDHRRPAAGEGDDDADDEGREQPDLRVDAGDEGKRDHLGDQGEGRDHAGKDVIDGAARRGEPLGAAMGRWAG